MLSNTETNRSGQQDDAEDGLHITAPLNPRTWREWLPIVVLLLGALLPPMDFYILNVALPEIRRSLSAAPFELQLCLAGYAGSYAVCLIPSTSLGDRYGRKRLFVVGLSSFTLSSAMCGIAWTPWILIFGRVAQGISAALMIPQILAIVRANYSSRVYPLVTGGIGFVYGTAALTGQYIAGALLAWQPFGWTWQAIFLVNVPVGLIASLIGITEIPDRGARQNSSINWIGSQWLSIAFSAFIIPTVLPPEFLSGLARISLMSLAAIGMVPFYHYQSNRIFQGRSFTVDVRLLQRRSFILCLILALLFFTGNIFFLVYAVFLQQGLGFAPLATASWMSPFGIGFICGPIASVKLVHSLGTKTLILSFGSLVVGFGALAMTCVVRPHAAVLHVMCLLIAGFGHGLTISSLLRVTLRHVYRTESGSASGLVNTALQFSTALGTAAFGSVFYWSLPQLPSSSDYGIAFARTMMCVVLMHSICVALSWILKRHDDKEHG